MAKKDHEHIYPANPYYQERYPHVHYRQQNLDYVYEQLAILKNWLESLTKLGAKLADTNSGEYGDLIDEITKLTNQIQDIINTIAAKLVEVNSVIDTHNTTIKNGIALIENNGQTLNNIIDCLAGVVTDVINCIELHLKKDDSYIGDINESLKKFGDIYINIDADMDDLKKRVAALEDEMKQVQDDIQQIFELLSRIVSQNYTTFTPTYTATFLNDFEGNPHVTGTRLTVENDYAGLNYITDTICFELTASSYPLSNKYIFDASTTPFLFAHTALVDSDQWNSSRLCRVDFSGNTYASHYTGTSAGEQFGNMLWNMLNQNGNQCGASWNVTMTDYYTRTAGIYILLLSSIGDGYNTNYSHYISNANLTGTDTIAKSETETIRVATAQPITELSLGSANMHYQWTWNFTVDQ